MNNTDILQYNKGESFGIFPSGSPLFLLFKKQQIFHLPSQLDNYKCPTKNSLDYITAKYSTFTITAIILYYLNIPMNCSKKDFLGISEVQK